MANDDVVLRIAALKTMTLGQLRAEYRALFGHHSASHNKDFLYRKLAYGLQVKAEGRTLADAARQRANALAAEALLHLRPPKRAPRQAERAARPPWLPSAGAPPTDDTAVTPVAPVPPVSVTPTGVRRDPRLPPPGTMLRRRHDGVEHVVIVHEHDVEYAGQRHASLSTVARLITGKSWNGYRWFRLDTTGPA